MERNTGLSAELAAVSASRQKLAERIHTPWWYHPALGTLAGLLVLVIGGSIGYGLVVMPLILLGTFGLGFLYRHLSGVDLRGPNAPDGGKRGRVILTIFVTSLVVCSAVAYLLGQEFGLGWAPWVLAAVALTTSIMAGRAYDGSLRTQLRGPNL